MLNTSRVLKYIKDNLGFPFSHFEFDDNDIIDYFTSYSLREFSHYFPYTEKINLNLLLPSSKVPGRGNEFYLETSKEILSVIDVYFPMGDYILFGHPPIGPFSLGELKEWALNVEVAGMIKHYSSYDKTFEFKHPNIVRISPIPTNIQNCTVEIETIQPTDLSGVTNDTQHYFLELALADAMIRIGSVRKKYGGQMRTPFGEIPINSEIYEEGKDKKRDILEKLVAGSIPNVSIEFG
jgi:hypothetical protein